MSDTKASRQTALITGANRGIGLAVVKELLAKHYDVISTARHPADAAELHAVKNDRLRVIALDITSEKSLAALPAATVDALGSLASPASVSAANAVLDVLVNNAGVFLSGTPSTESDPAATIHATNTANVVGPLLVTRALLPLLKRVHGNSNGATRARVFNVSSAVGSIAQYVAIPQAVIPTSIAFTAYRMSKAALNMLTVDSASQHKDVTFVALHPGMVDTDMAHHVVVAPDFNAVGMITTEQSARGIAAIVHGSTHAEHNAKFRNVDGTLLQW